MIGSLAEVTVSPCSPIWACTRRSNRAIQGETIGSGSTELEASMFVPVCVRLHEENEAASSLDDQLTPARQATYAFACATSLQWGRLAW